MLTFTNRTALVTGAGRGIGRAIAETLARNGVSVVCVSKSADSCGAAAAAITASGGKARALAVDVADGAAVGPAPALTAADVSDFSANYYNPAGLARAPRPPPRA